MHAGVVVAILAAAALAGCAAGEPVNPHLGAPKLVLAPRPDGANSTVFIHSAFGERAYEWIELRVDNETVANRSAAFSLEEIVINGFYLEARAELGDALYQLRARVDVFPAEARASLAFVDAEGEWATRPESFGLPVERLLERRAET